MSSQTTQPQVPVYYLIVVRPEPPGQFTAQPVGVPEVRAVAATREEAIEQARRAMSEWPGSLHWVPVEMQVPFKHPLQDYVGYAKDDPHHEDYLEEIRRFRQEVDERESFWPESDCR